MPADPRRALPLAGPGERAMLGVANGLIVGAFALAAILHASRPGLYQRAVQEDGLLEWSTFWLFALAGAAYLRAAVRRRRGGAVSVWFPLSVGLFCLFVALEEISWGQRILGSRPPDYFLEHNFQQETNLHNLLDDWLRQAAFLSVVLGYGVALPLAAGWGAIGRRIARAGILPPPIGLAPGFALTGLVYAVYPWSHTGEWAELALGSGMLFAAAATHRVSGARAAWGGPARPLVAWLLALAFGLVSAELSVTARSQSPALLDQARRELEALRSDFAAARTRTRCGLHKRVYSFVEKYEQHHLHEGAFAKLVSAGLPAERAAFFLDPWNSPYWIRHACTADRRRRAIFVYSLGPNRRRDSTEWTVEPDDLAAWLSRPKSDSGDLE